MGMTITEKILAAHCGKARVEPGEMITAKIDAVLCNDITTPAAITMLKEKGMDRVFDPDKIVVTPDHFVPNKDIKSAELAKRLREWVYQHNIQHYYEIGRHGVCHAIFPEEGYVRPGTAVVSADSHTCTHGALGAFATGIGSTDLAAVIYSGELWFKVPESMKFVLDGKLPEGVHSKDIILEIIRRTGVDGALYRAMEFTGPVIGDLSIEARMTICNMAIEAGAKSGIIAADEATLSYVEARTDNPFEVVTSDPDATNVDTMVVDVSDLAPMVAFPAVQRETRVGDRKNPGGSGVHRLVHERTHRGPADRGEDSQGPEGRSENALPDHSGHHESLAAGDGRGSVRRLPGCRMRHFYAHVRGLPRRVHGHPGRGRTVHLHHEPELRGTDGTSQVGGVSRKPGHGGGFGN
jgi:homoaconitase/3-isopropylmalate dehydratase large subunit